MASFDSAFTHLLKWEGTGYTDLPSDRGGPTKYGITEKFARATGCKTAIRDLTEEQAKALYRTGFWTPLRLDAEPSQAAAESLFQAAVNSGLGFANTARAALAYELTTARVFIAQVKHYAAIVKADKAQAVNLAGWLNRALDFLAPAPAVPPATAPPAAAPAVNVPKEVPMFSKMLKSTTIHDLVLAIGPQLPTILAVFGVHVAPDAVAAVLSLLGILGAAHGRITATGPLTGSATK